MGEEKKTSIEEALTLGYLEDKKVYLKAVVNNSGNKYDSDKTHIGYWSFEGTSKQYELPKLAGIKEKLFPEGKKQQQFFEEQLGANLDPYDANSWWYSAAGKVRIYKEERLFNDGIEFDLRKPEDWVKYQVLKHCASCYTTRNICPVGEEPLPQKDIMRLMESGVEGKKAADEAEKYAKVFMFIGENKTNPQKLREFLTVMSYELGELKSIPDDWTDANLLQESMRMANSDKYRNIIYSLITGKDYDVKVTLYKAILAGAIDKLGRNSYRISWLQHQNYDYKGMVHELASGKEDQNEDYMKIVQMIRSKEEKKKK